MLLKLVPVIATLLLCACVLSSKTPKFAAADGAAAIAANTEFDAYTKDGNGWRKEDESFSFKRDGKAYLMSDGKNIASVSFIQLTPEWFAAQYRENDEPFFYGLVRTTGGGLDITPLPCDKLKAFAAGTKDLAFSGDDCSIDAVADPKAFFTTLIDKIPGPEMKLVPRP